MLKGHGDDIYHYTTEIVSNFSSNIYNRQDLSALYGHLSAQMELIHTYPEPDAASLTRMLADQNGISVDNICTTSGATEAIYLIAQLFRNCRTGIFIPAFSEYEDACVIHAHKLSFFQNIHETDDGARLIWICNPNNPDGQTHDLDALTGLVVRREDTVFVIDQSYGSFSKKQVWSIRQAVKYRNVILLHSMTKQYAIPGLRLGYITANTDIIREITKHRMPWSVNGLAVEAGKFLLKHEINPPDMNHYLDETARLQEALRQIPGLFVYPTDTHFFLCKLKSKNASDLKSWLVDNYGILIRDASNFRGLDEHYFRLVTRSPQENNQLVKAIRAWI